MTESTIQAKVPHVHFMAVGDGLRWTVADVSVPGGSIVPYQTHNNNQGQASTNSGIQRGFIRPFGEYLSQDLSLYFFSKVWVFWGLKFPSELRRSFFVFSPPFNGQHDTIQSK
jgi:hypothetical protein